MNTLILSIIILVVILAVVLLIKLGRKLWYKLVGIAVALLIFSGAFTSYTQHITNPIDLFKAQIASISNLWDKSAGKTPTDTAQSSSATSTSKTTAKSNSTVVSENIMRRLLEDTNSSSPSSTRNYAWTVDNAHLKDDSKIQNGALSFSADKLGRSSLAMGKLTYSLYAGSKGSRQGEPLDPPNGGWPRVNPYKAISYAATGRTYHGYFWNRSHSIADSLGGTATYSSANNFTAGTRPQNVGADQKGGMRTPENLVERYWQEHPNSTVVMHYQAQPVYYGDEKIPRGTIVDIKASNNDLDVEYVIVNSAEGYKINYNTGDITTLK